LTVTGVLVVVAGSVAVVVGSLGVDASLPWWLYSRAAVSRWLDGLHADDLLLLRRHRLELRHHREHFRKLPPRRNTECARRLHARLRRRWQRLL